MATLAASQLAVARSDVQVSSIERGSGITRSWARVLSLVAACKPDVPVARAVRRPR